MSPGLIGRTVQTLRNYAAATAAFCRSTYLAHKAKPRATVRLACALDVFKNLGL